jgi:hypothetical protein
MEVHTLLPALLAHPAMVPTFLEQLCSRAPAMLADLVMAIMLMNDIPHPNQIAVFMQEQQRQAAHEQQLQQLFEAHAAHVDGGSLPGTAPAPDAAQAVPLGNSAAAANGSRPGSGTDTKAVAVAMPTSMAAATLLQRALGAGGDSSRFSPAGKPALPLELPHTASQEAGQSAAPAPATLVLLQALQAGTPLVPPIPLSAVAASALHASAVRRICAAATGLPGRAADLRRLLLARLAAQATAATQLQPVQAAADIHAATLGAAAAEIQAGQGHGLALRWLTALLAQQMSRSSGSLQEGGAAAAEQLSAAPQQLTGSPYESTLVALMDSLRCAAWVL